ncbi:inverse autotransporter beta domain-containing protein, partial [Enterobacter sp. A103]|uniref:inverse autotransporter beta domain-containing protein n=1 Tax=Enterobacter sp. A103 TaxID=3102785 RepID=UPI002ACAE74F
MVTAAEKSTINDGVLPSWTRPWTLREGETVSDVALRYHLSVVALKKMNQFRTFSKPFEKLSAGDEIDVPFSENPSDTVPQGAQSSHATSGETAEVRQWLSGSMSSLAQATTGPHHSSVSNAAASQARSAAVSGSEQVVSDWLSQFGTARVQLGVNDHFSLNDSAADVLMPLYDNGHDMLFTQLGGRRHDDRTTLNGGVGVRLFRGKWMYGMNTFFDNDLTGHNRRVGVGAEAWTDYLKLSANGYFGLTGWHQSRDDEDYDERPADGLDVTANGWLPAYPQIGGKLKYEQYFGDAVGLLDKNTRQKNPKALTVGVSYTPVPLVTMGSDYRKSGGKDDLQLNAQFTWNFGQSLSEQIAPDGVAFAHSLAGNRTGLVERNNNIVLDYRKQEPIRLSLPAQAEGRALERIPLTVMVQAKYGLDHIIWQATGLESAGGKITGDGTQWFLQLPDYIPGQDNRYLVSATAWDTRGNHTPSQDLAVTVRGSGVDVAQTTVTATDGLRLASDDVQVPADGRSVAHFDLVLKDGNGRPVTGQASRIILPVTFKPLGGAGGMTTASRFSVTSVLDAATQAAFPKAYADDLIAGGVRARVLSEREPGVYMIEVAAGARAGRAQIIPHLDGKALPPLSLTFVVPVILTSGDIQVLRDGLPADGMSADVVQVAVKNSQGQPVSGTAVSFASAGLGVSVPSAPVMTNAQGVAAINVTSTRVGDFTVKVTANGVSQSVVVHFTATTALGSAGAVFGQPPAGIHIEADNRATGHLTFIVHGADGQPSVGQVVHFAVGGKNLPDSTTSTTGEVTVQLPPSQTPGDIDVIAGLDNKTTQTVKVHYMAGNHLLVKPQDVTLTLGAPSPAPVVVTPVNGGTVSYASSDATKVAVDTSTGALEI